ncbi:MAG: hypothetical protein FJZ58_03340 [Chlamydiae bacterium]|nr:hypothetical protein [Chlamydiota bacterium]
MYFLKPQHIFSVLCFGLLAVPSLESTPQDIALLKRVRDYWAEGDLSLAKRQIELYLQEHPQGELLEELSVLLGDAYVHEGNFTQALHAYATVQKPSLCKNIAYNRALCLYETKKTEELFLFLEQIPAHFLSLEQNQSLSYLCASLLLEGGRFDDTIALAKRCEHSTLRIPALSLLMKAYRSLGDKKQAAFYCMALAKELPAQEADFLFEAACLFADNTQQKALSLFTKLASCSFSKRGDAAYNALLVYYNTHQFRDVVLWHEAHQDLFNEEQAVQAHYFVGKSLYILKDYIHAAKALSCFLEKCSPSSQEDLLLTLLDCLYQNKDLQAYEKLLPQLLASTNQQDLHQETEYAHLHLLLTQGSKQDFLAKTESFLLNYQDSLHKEELILRLIHAYYEESNWQRTDYYIREFCTLFPSSSHLSHLQRLQLNCASILMQASSQEALIANRDYLIVLQQRALHTEHLLSPEERENISLELAHNLIANHRYSEALDVLSHILATYPTTASLQEVRMLRVSCYHHIPEALPLFIEEASQLVSSLEKPSDRTLLLLHLFNAYIELALHDQAANTLYTLFSQEGYPLPKENIRWLADHYYTAAETDSESLQRAFTLLDTLLAYDDSYQEEVVYKLISLFSKQNEQTKKITLLEEWFTKHPFSGEKLQRNLLLELANTHFALQHRNRALELYDTLIRTQSSSQIGIEALYRRCTLLFSNLTAEEYLETNPAYMDILHQLKDLEHIPTVTCDPLQLEAGLTYIDYRLAPLQELLQKEQKGKELLSLFLQHTAFKQTQSPAILAYKTIAEAEGFLLQGAKEEALSLLSSLQQELSLASVTKERLYKLLQEAQNP